MSTPLSAKVGGSKRRADADEDFFTMQRRLDGLLSPEPTDPIKSMTKLFPTDFCADEMKQILRSIVEREKSLLHQLLHCDASSAGVWALGVKLYHRLVNNLVGIYASKQRAVSSVDLLKDGSFHRSCMLIAFECVRYGFKVESIKFPDLFHLIGPKTVEFCLVLVLVTERETWVRSLLVS